jgi:hypothetical protein
VGNPVLLSIEKEKKFKKISDMNIQIRTRFCVTQSLYTYYIPMKYPLHIAFSKAYQFKTFSWQTMWLKKTNIYCNFEIINWIILKPLITLGRTMNYWCQKLSLQLQRPTCVRLYGWMKIIHTMLVSAVNKNNIGALKV